ncbi:MAG TPA: hypothetical protein VF609_06115 [Flavisolibacter sp.]
MKIRILYIFLFLAPGSVFAQDSLRKRHVYHTIKSTDILVGIHAQMDGEGTKNYTFYEIGVAKAIYRDGRHGASGSAVYLSEELHFGRDKNIYGTKFGIWHHWLLDVGLAVVYYTDLRAGNLKVRPEIGVGMARHRVVMGYNIPTIDNTAFKELQKNKLQFSAQITFGIHRKIVQSHSY